MTSVALAPQAKPEQPTSTFPIGLRSKMIYFKDGDKIKIKYRVGSWSRNHKIPEKNLKMDFSNCLGGCAHRQRPNCGAQWLLLWGQRWDPGPNIGLPEEPSHSTDGGWAVANQSEPTEHS